MIVVMQSFADQGSIEGVIQRLTDLGLGAHVSGGQERTVIGVIGTGFSPDLPGTMELLPGVDHVTRITRPYKLVSSEFRATPTIVEVGDVRFGSDEFIVMAGPCSVESREQVLLTARAVKAAGGRVLRGGAFKPRTSPYSFQGLGRAALEMLAEAREETGLPIITEVMEPGDVDLVSNYADILQVGTRNMQNFPLLKEVGKTRKAVLLKRGMSGTIEEWLMAAEYVMAGGNFQVIMGERGIRTFETAARNTLDLSAVPILKRLSHLPVIADPSHGTGKWYLVKPLSLAALAVGADGLLLEVHPTPDTALSDGPQSLTLEGFADLMNAVRKVGPAVGRRVAEPALAAVAS